MKLTSNQRQAGYDRTVQCLLRYEGTHSTALQAQCIVGIVVLI